MRQLLMTFIFAMGFFMHCLIAAQKSVRTAESPSMGVWLCRWWTVVLGRLSLTLAFYLLYAENAMLADKMLSWANVKVEYSLPVTPVTSFLIGFFSDSILDLLGSKIKFLSRDIPTYDPAKPCT